MKPPRFKYQAPATLEAVLALLGQYGERARILAGGQSLVPILNFRLATPEILIDINRTAGLAGIEMEDDGTLVVGAMTRERALEEDPRVRGANPLLAAAMPYIAHTQIRNRGTLGGSLAHADPAAELPAVSLACDACFDLLGLRGARTVAAADFFRGIYATALEPDELLVRVRFPAWPPGMRFGFRELARRHGDFALAGIALTVRLGESGGCSALRIVGFGIGDTPERLRAAEAELLDRVPDAAAITRAARAAATACSPRGDIHASAAYRRELLEVLLRRALDDALAGPRHDAPADARARAS